MKNKLPLENSELHEAFGIILTIDSFSTYIHEIAELVYKNELEKNTLEGILAKNNLISADEIKGELLDLLIVYINLILNDHEVSDNELSNIQYIKKIFNVKEGDFYNHRSDEIEDILSKQFFRMYRNDDKIDFKEAVHKVNLQKLFDLGYDQLMEFSAKEIMAALERGADITNLDSTFKIHQTEMEVLSRRITQEVKDKVWNRDGGKCVTCGGNEKLEFDHIIPFSKGGSNTYRNIQLLCEACNRKKSNRIGNSN